VHWKPTAGDDPTLLILGLLIATIGLPYLMLSTTSPLLQAWYWRHHQTKVPYRLFALSNFASLLALLAYPVAIEPWLPNRGQTVGWSALYVVFVLLCGATGYASYRAAPHPAKPTPELPVELSSELSSEQGKLAPRQLLTWLALSAAGSCLLIAVTNHITQNIAAVPFLWVLPLSLYLITFILAFDHPRWYARPVFMVLLAIVIPSMGYMVDSHGLGIAVLLYAAGLFVGCMFLHGELAMTKPAPRHLTAFYLMMSVGGALGSLLVGVIAPLTLPGYYELGLVLMLIAALAIMRVWPMHLLVRLAAIGVAIATVVVVAQAMWRYSVDIRVMTRNFYGVIRTRDYADPAPYRTMYHGGIKHGGQLLGDAYRRTPSSYFGPTSGYGRLFASLPDEGPRTIGVIGLGAGALAVYGRERDTMVFYELDPQVVDVAWDEFTFLSDMPGTVEVVVGDGRLALEREESRGYDVLAIDAFSGDSIPMHLITREAMASYVRHLKPDGAIVFQATNRYIDIIPVVERLAAEHGMTAVLVSDIPEIDENGPTYWLATTDQIIVTRNQALLEAGPVKAGAEAIAVQPDFPVFTDDYTNLFRILK
jgi:spermidine synthase